MWLRIFSLLCLSFVAAFFPLHAAVFLFVVFSSIFSKYWEGVLIGFFLDSFYFSPLLFSKFNLGFFTISFIAAIFILEKVKRFIDSRNLILRIALGVIAGLLSYLVIFLLFNY